MDDIEITLNRIENKIKEKDYYGALQLAQKLAEENPNHYRAHYYYALILKMLRFLDEAMDEVAICLDLDGENFIGYELALILFNQSKHTDYNQMIFDILANSEFEDCLSIRWCKAWTDIIEGTEDYEKDLAIYKEIAEELDRRKEDYYWLSTFYYEYTNLLADEGTDRKTLISILDKGLESYPNDIDCLDYKAWLLKRENRKDEARALYERMADTPGVGLFTSSMKELASIYYGDSRNSADQALKIYQFLLSENDDPILHYYAGMCERNMGNLEEAEKHFLKEQELDPEDVDGYYWLSYVYEAAGRLEEALVQIDNTLEIVRTWDNNRDYSVYFVQKSYILRKMGRMDEAVEAILEAKSIYGDLFNEYPSLINIWEQAGNWRNTEIILKQWEETSKNTPDYPYESDRCSAVINYYIMTKQFDQAQQYYKKHKESISQKNQDSFMFILDSLSGSANVYLELYRRQYDNTKHNNIDYPGIVGSYADALWLNGNIEQAQKIAKEAVDLIDEDYERFHTSKPINLVDRAGALFVLNRFDEANKDLETAKHHNMCEVCAYKTCKDVDIYRIRGLIHQGKDEEALELIKKYEEKWPDETDFIFYENLLKNKKK